MRLLLAVAFFAAVALSIGLSIPLAATSGAAFIGVLVLARFRV